MAKTCKHPGCTYPVFGKGYCKFHQYKRNDIKKTINKRSKRIAPPQITESTIFDEILRSRPLYSFISGIRLTGYLGSHLHYNLFAHVIPKRGHNRIKFRNTFQKNRLLRVNKENIVLLTPREHYLFDHGTEEQRQKYAEEMKKKGILVNWDKLYKYKEELVEKIIKETDKKW